jgi:hypothetical protein
MLPSRCSEDGTAFLGNLEDRVGYCIDHFDELTVVCDASTASYHHCKMLSGSELIIEGRVLDSCIANRARTGHIKAVCILDPLNLHLVHGNEVHAPVLKVVPEGGGLRELMSVQLRSVKLLCALLKKYEIGYVFSGGVVEGQCRTEMVTAGFGLVDSVPMPYMKFLCDKSGCLLWEHTTAVLEALPFKDDEPATWLQFTSVDWCTLAKDRKVRILGIAKPSPVSHPCAPQLLIHGRNSHELGIVVKLCKRALNSVRGAFVAEDMSSSSAMRASRESLARPEGNVVVCGGQGVMDWSWALIWKDVANRVMNGIPIKLAVDEIDSQPVAALELVSSILHEVVAVQVNATYLIASTCQRSAICDQIHTVCLTIASAYNEMCFLGNYDSIRGKLDPCELFSLWLLDSPVPDHDAPLVRAESAKLFWSSKYHNSGTMMKFIRVCRLQRSFTRYKWGPLSRKQTLDYFSLGNILK